MADNAKIKGPPLPFGPPPEPVRTALHRFWREDGELRHDQAEASYVPYPFMPGGDEMRVRFPDDPNEIRFPRAWFANPGNPVYPGRYVTVNPDPAPAAAELGIRYGRDARSTLDAEPAKETETTLYRFHYGSDGSFHREAVAAKVRYARTGTRDDMFETPAPEPGNPFPRMTPRHGLERPMSASTPPYEYVSLRDDPARAKAGILGAMRRARDSMREYLDEAEAWISIVEDAQKAEKGKEAPG